MFKKVLTRSQSVVRKFAFSSKEQNSHMKPDFTKNKYNVTRGNFNVLEEEHIYFFRRLLGEDRLVTDLSDLEKYNVDWWKLSRGSSSIVLKPKTSQEVSQILSFCNNNKLAVCPQGGNTGLVGGCTPVFDEIIISTELMNQIVELDETSGTLLCQAGCILGNIENFLNERDLIFPLDLGAKGSCQIGGNVSTNAGGIRLLKYGNLHANVLGLEVVTADGVILDCMSVLKKDNTGYHLKNLFIGSEGTLGIVTKVAVQCRQRPKSVNVAFLGCQNFEKVLKTFQKSKQDLDEILTAFEVMDASTMELVQERLHLESPIGEYPFYVLIETSGSNSEHDESKMNSFLESCLMKHFVLNGISTGELSKIKKIWAIRERIPEAIVKDGYVFIYDVSLPLKDYYRLVCDMRDHMQNDAKRIFGFGHLGDGNLHIQISVEDFSKEMLNRIEPFIFERTKALNGSISAEHGIGFLKARYLPIAKSPAAIRTMKNLKRSMDPNGILNPYKIFAES